MLDLLHKKSYDIFVQPFLKQYLKKERWFVFNDLKLKIYPGVFHPAFFFSTMAFADFMQTLDLKNKKVCEVGAGSGLLSFNALSKEAQVFSFDINSIAVKGLKENLNNNFPMAKNFEIYQSDLFDSIPKNEFDIFLINPPYFFSDPSTTDAFAWYCGKNGEYFGKLFKQLSDYSNSSSQVYMVLAENCELERIKSIAKKHNYFFNLVSEKKIKWEKNFIFKIIKQA